MPGPPTLRDLGNELGFDLSAMLIPATQVSGIVGGSSANVVTALNVKIDYGAVGNGIANDTAAIQAAIDASAAAGGGVVFFPPGTYLLGSGLKIKTNVQLLGAGARSAVLKANVAMNMLSPNAINQTDWKIQGLGFDLNSKAGAFGVVIDLAGCDFAEVDSCEFKNLVGGTFTAGLYSNAASNYLTVSNNQFLGPGAATADSTWGSYFSNGTANFRVTGNTYVGPFNACEINNNGTACHDFLVSYNIIRSCGKVGIINYGCVDGAIVGNELRDTLYVGGPADGSFGIAAGYLNGAGPARVAIVGNTLRNFGEINAFDAVGFTITGNKIYGAQSPGIEFGYTVGVVGANTNITANYIEGSATGSGIFIGRASDVNVIGNTCVNCGQDGITISNLASGGTTGIRVIGNICKGNTQDGIAILANTGVATTDIVCAYNTCTGNGTYGVLISNIAAIQRIRLEFNYLIGNAVATNIGALVTHVRQFGNIIANADYDANLFTIVQALALTYGATVNTDASLSNYFTLGITNGTAFTMAAPTNPVAGDSITYDIKNSSGGAHGVITWNAAFLNGGAGTVGTGAFAGIANGKRRLVVFRYDGTSWIEQSRTADV